MALRKFRAPSLPVPPKGYDQNYMTQLVRILGSYFNLLDSRTAQEIDTVRLVALPTDAAQLPDGSAFRLPAEDLVRIVVDGVTPAAVATESYVDAAEAAAIITSNNYTDAGLALKVNKSGDVMTGNLTVPTLNATNVSTTNTTTTNLVGNTNVPTGSSLLGATAGAIKAPGMVLQVQQVIKTNAYTQVTSGNTYYPVPGLSVKITPTSANSKILVTCTVNLGSSSYQGRGIVYRDSTPLGLGDNVSLRTGVSFGFNAYDSGTGDIYHVIPCNFTFLDLPASTSELTYSVSVSAYNTYGISVNRSWAWQDFQELDPAFSSTITVIEIAA